jgi:bla regulator protein BlaR1
MHIIPDTILRAVCWTLLHSLWQGLLVAMIAGLVLVLTKKSSSSIRYNLLCGLLFLFLAVSGYTFYHQLSPTASPAITAATPAVTVAAQQSAPVHNLVPPVTSGVVLNGIDNLIQYFNTHAALVVLVWFIIFLGRFVQLLSGWVYAQRIRHYQTSVAAAEWQQRLRELLKKVRITRPVLLLESALIRIPVVIGFLKPVILVPVGMLAHMAPDQVESILLHELAHIRRQDYLFNLVQNLVDTLFFFNPAMIWLSSLIRMERENCCDDVAIRETRSRRRLIEALVSFHEYEQSATGYKSAAGYALSFAAKENQVVRRVKRIVHKKNHSLNAGERVLLMAGLLILSAAFITINNGRADAPKKSPRALVAPTPAPTKSSPAFKTLPGHTAIPAPIQRPANPVGKPVQTPVGDTTPKTPTPADLFQNVSVDKIIEAKEHGVTPEFIGDLQQMGYKNFSLDKAIALRDHGVDAEFIRDLQKLGYADLSLDKAIALKDHGVNPEFIAGLHDLGFTTIKLDKAIELKDHGVTVEYIAEMKKRFGKLLELNDYIKLRDAGISSSSI